MAPSRRDFLRSAASLLAAIQKASAIDPPTGSTFLDAEHVVILMQENRSFDHCYGRLRGVRGFNDPRAVTLPNQNPVWLQTNAAGESYTPFRLDIKKTRSTWLGSLPHSWTDQTDARNHGNHDRWLDAKATRRRDCAGMPLTLGYYDRSDIPFYYALADAFTVCDQNFCSSLTGTTPNRLFLWTGTIREKQEAASLPMVRNSEVTYSANARWTTFPERLERAGVSWKIYQNELSLPTGFNREEDNWLSNFTDNPIEWFEQYHVGFHAPYRRHLEALAATGKPQKLPVRSERAKWTDEAWGKLSPEAKSLHRKAFVTNTGDPAYRQLEKLSYQGGEMQVPKGDVLHQFRQDVKSGSLPAVSWLVAPSNFSDHPGSPWYGAWYVAEALDILTKNPELWKKTIFLLAYDENDGYFDHVPPFVAPNPADPLTGKTSPSLDPALEYLPLEQDLTRQKPADARGGPVGLGYRVPLVVASPWSRGGYVNSQVFDHTSVLQLLEKWTSHRTGRAIRETNISAWRRAVCGDLTSAFRPFTGGEDPKLSFPPRNEFLEQVHKARLQPLPSGFQRSGKPAQEPGTRPSCGLFYQLYAEASVRDGALELTLEAGTSQFGKQSLGSPFHVYTPGKYRDGIQYRTRAYAVAAGERLTDAWKLDGFAGGRYHLHVHGPNGFFREMAGTADGPALELHCEYVRAKDVELRAVSSNADCELEITDHYRGKTEKVRLSRGVHKTWLCSLDKSSQWYDFTVRSGAFLRRYAGRVDTGRPGASDPAIS